MHFCRWIAISNYFISQSPKTCSSFLIISFLFLLLLLLCECNSQDSFSHISFYNKLQLIYECNPSHRILHLLARLFISNCERVSKRERERDKCKILNANCQPGWWQLRRRQRFALYISKEKYWQMLKSTFSTQIMKIKLNYERNFFVVFTACTVHRNFFN